MILHKRMFFGEESGKHRFEFRWKLKHNKFPSDSYVLVLPEKGSTNLLELLPGKELSGKFRKWDWQADRSISLADELIVIGIAENKEEAIEVARDIVDLVYQQTGGLDIRTFFIPNKQ